MTEPVPHTPFLVNLDEANLRQVCTRLEALEPYVAEYKELVKRRRFLEVRLGKTSKADQVRQLLAAHPRGLTRNVIGDQLGISVGLSGVLGELKKQGHITQPARSVYRITDAGNAAVHKEVVAEDAA